MMMMMTMLVRDASEDCRASEEPRGGLNPYFPTKLPWSARQGTAATFRPLPASTCWETGNRRKGLSEWSERDGSMIHLTNADSLCLWATPPNGQTGNDGGVGGPRDGNQSLPTPHRSRRTRLDYLHAASGVENPTCHRITTLRTFRARQTNRKTDRQTLSTV